MPIVRGVCGFAPFLVGAIADENSLLQGRKANVQRHLNTASGGGGNRGGSCVHQTECGPGRPWCKDTTLETFCPQHGKVEILCKKFPGRCVWQPDVTCPSDEDLCAGAILPAGCPAAPDRLCADIRCSKHGDSCADCLGEEGCALVGDSFCASECIADLGCLSTEWLDKSVAETCSDVEQRRADQDLCGEPVTCGGCMDTAKSDGSPCQWFVLEEGAEGFCAPTNPAWFGEAESSCTEAALRCASGETRFSELDECCWETCEDGQFGQMVCIGCALPECAPDEEPNFVEGECCPQTCRPKE